MLERLNQLFPLWAALLSLLAFVQPAHFAPLEWAIVPALAGVMFCMGLTLNREDFLRIARAPLAVVVGVSIQFILMPILALTLATMLQLSNQLTIGMVLVGSCAGGTASNVICFLARGDVALSISMTLASTLLGVVLTPLLCRLFLSQSVAVDSLAMLLNLVQLVLLPLLCGFALKAALGSRSAVLDPYLPSVAMCLILLIVATIVALNANRLTQVGPITLIAVMAHNAGGLAGGFFVSRLFGFDLRQSQTIAIEVGMQNSGLGVALALQFFSATAALPGALFSV
jgi:BASS family bile acid:Na+ symporter